MTLLEEMITFVLESALEEANEAILDNAIVPGVTVEVLDVIDDGAETLEGEERVLPSVLETLVATVGEEPEVNGAETLEEEKRLLPSVLETLVAVGDEEM